MPKRSEKLVTSGSAQLFTEATGTAGNGTILLVMGATASLAWWPDSLVDALAAGGYQVIRFDHRDTGRSTTNAPGDIQYDLHDMAGDLLAILDAYEVAAAHVVGMSLGGYLAQIDAITHPERGLSLTLLAAEPLGITYEGEGIAPALMQHFGTMGELDWSDRAAVTQFMLGIERLSAGSAVPFDTDAAMTRISTELSRTDSMQSAFNHSMLGGEIDPALTAKAITQPLLVIHGSEDPVISVAGARTTAAVVPGATLLVLEGRGHEILAQDVPDIAEAILQNCRGARNR